MRWQQNGILAAHPPAVARSGRCRRRGALGGLCCRQHPYQGTSPRGRRQEGAGQKRGAGPWPCPKEALGRSPGGLTTKIHLEAHGRARRLSLVLSQGQVNDSQMLEATLEGVRVPRPGRGRPRKRPGKLRADKGYRYPKCRKLLRGRGIGHLIPERGDQREQRKKRRRAVLGGAQLFSPRPSTPSATWWSAAFCA